MKNSIGTMVTLMVTVMVTGVEYTKQGGSPQNIRSILQVLFLTIKQ